MKRTHCISNFMQTRYHLHYAVHQPIRCCFGWLLFRFLFFFRQQSLPLSSQSHWKLLMSFNFNLKWNDSCNGNGTIRVMHPNKIECNLDHMHIIYEHISFTWTSLHICAASMINFHLKSDTQTIENVHTHISADRVWIFYVILVTGTKI